MVKKKERIPKFKDVKEAYAWLYKKKVQEQLRKKAEQRFKTQQALLSTTTISMAGIAEAQARQKERQMQVLGSRAEQIENYLCSINEVPLLHYMERARTKGCTPPDNFIRRAEKEATDSMPD